MLAIVPSADVLPTRPLLTRDKRSPIGRRLLNHESRLFVHVGGEASATPAQCKAVADAAELALAADMARAQYIEGEISAEQMVKVQDAARDAERALKESPR